VIITCWCDAQVESLTAITKTIQSGPLEPYWQGGPLSSYSEHTEVVPVGIIYKASPCEHEFSGYTTDPTGESARLMR
jgi:hypothetical protein